MKITSVILMSLLVLSVSTQESFMFMIFKLNQAHITAHHCQNLDNPELECNGTCFLNEKMNEAHDHKKEDPLPFMHTEKTNLLFLAPGWSHPVPARLMMQFSLQQKNEFPDGLIWSSRLFRPPIT